MFDAFSEENPDKSTDWWTDYFQDEQGDRNALKQDFTPLKFLMVDYHPDRQTQEYVASMVRQVFQLEEQERKIIEGLKEQKRYYLGTMFTEVD